jgi:hypothetical protein
MSTPIYIYDTSKIYRYLSRFLPEENLDKTMIIDYVAGGRTITKIVETYKNILSEDNKLPSDKQKISNTKRPQFKSFIRVLSKEKEDVKVYNDSGVQYTPHIINIYRYFTDALKFLIDAEYTNSRCIPKNTEFEDIDVPSKKDPSFKSYGCDFFVYTAILYSDSTIKTKIDEIIEKLNIQQPPIEQFYSNYGANKLVNLEIYNEDTTTSVLTDIMIPCIAHGNVYTIVNHERDYTEKNYIRYESIINTTITKTFNNFKCIIPSHMTTATEYSIYNISYNDGENDISADNMVYEDDRNYLKFIPLSQIDHLKGITHIDENIIIKIFPKQLITTELVEELAGEDYDKFMEFFNNVKKDKDKVILIILKKCIRIQGFFIDFLPGDYGIKFKDINNKVYNILYYLIDKYHYIV